jgi:hypothetical protein
VGPRTLSVIPEAAQHPRLRGGERCSYIRRVIVSPCASRAGTVAFTVAMVAALSGRVMAGSG